MDPLLGDSGGAREEEGYEGIKHASGPCLVVCCVREKERLQRN